MLSRKFAHNYFAKICNDFMSCFCCHKNVPFVRHNSDNFPFLKVPKREIFDRSDFPDFYTIKSLRVGDFGVKIKKILQNIQGFIQGCKVPYAYAQCIFKEIFFLSFDQKFFFSMALLRPLVSVKNYFLKFLIFQVLKIF